MAFHVGQKVVYIGEQSETWSLWFRKLIHPEPGPDLDVGGIYVISKLEYEGDILWDVWLAGVDNRGDDYWSDGFMPECFRPVIERKTDISIFTGMLTEKRRELTNVQR